VNDSFVVQIPPGATEIDLRPVLAPIVRAIMKNEEGKFEHYAEEHVDQFFDRFVTETKLVRLMERIKWEWVRDYMLANGWRRSPPSSGSAQYYPPKVEHYYGPTGICVLMKERYVPAKTLTTNYNLIQQTWNAVRLITQFEQRKSAVLYGQMFLTAQSILDHSDAVTRMGDVVR